MIKVKYLLNYEFNNNQLPIIQKNRMWIKKNVKKFTNPNYLNNQNINRFLNKHLIKFL